MEAPGTWGLYDFTDGVWGDPIVTYVNEELAEEHVRVVRAGDPSKVYEVRLIPFESFAARCVRIDAAVARGLVELDAMLANVEHRVGITSWSPPQTFDPFSLRSRLY